MEFRLTYRGPLKTKKSTTAVATQALRRHFHTQLKVLWETPLLEAARPFVDPSREPRQASDICLLEKVGPFVFAPLVTQVYGWNAVAKISAVTQDS